MLQFAFRASQRRSTYEPADFCRYPCLFNCSFDSLGLYPMELSHVFDVTANQISLGPTARLQTVTLTALCICTLLKRAPRMPYRRRRRARVFKKVPTMVAGPPQTTCNKRICSQMTFVCKCSGKARSELPAQKWQQALPRTREHLRLPI